LKRNLSGSDLRLYFGLGGERKIVVWLIRGLVNRTLFQNSANATKSKAVP